MKTGTQRIYNERKRQLTELKFTPYGDDGYISGELLDAAICYASAASQLERGQSFEYIKLDPMHWCKTPWPWDMAWWKPSPNIERNLEKAGALIAAELDRRERKRCLPDESGLDAEGES